MPTPRRCRTKGFLTRQATLPLQALHRAYTSELHGFMFTKLLKVQPRFCHRVAHRAAHRWEPCEICGVVVVLRSENVRDDQVVGEAGEGFARVSRVGRVSIAALLLFLSRASFLTGHRVGRVGGFVSASCASLCLEASENVRDDKIPRRLFLLASQKTKATHPLRSTTYIINTSPVRTPIET